MASTLCLFLLLFNISLSADCCKEACYACSKLDEEECKEKKFCIEVPSRNSDQGVIPAAEIYVRIQGDLQSDKPAVLFVHGNAFSSDYFKCQQAELASCNSTIAIDLRGYGRSSKTTPKPSQDPNSIDYTYEVWADDIKAVLDNLGINRFYFVGSSIGANIGVVYTLRYPGQVQKLVLQGGDPLVTVLDPTCTNAFCQVLPTCFWQFPALTTCLLNFANQFIQQNGFEAFVRQIQAPLVFNEACQEALASAQDLVVETFLLTGLDILLNTVFNADLEDLRPLLSQINVPTLICYGSIDAVVPPGASIFMHEQIPNSILVEFVGKGHQLQISDYKNFNRILNEFFNGCSMPDFIKVFDVGCCICPKAKPTSMKPCVH